MYYQSDLTLFHGKVSQEKMFSIQYVLKRSSNGLHISISDQEIFISGEQYYIENIILL